MAWLDVRVDFFDPNDREAMKRLWRMTRDERVQEYVGGVEGMTLGDVRYWAGQFGQGRNREVLLAVYGRRGVVGKLEVDKVQGFVCSYLLGSRLIERMAKLGWLDEDKKHFEISFAKVPGTMKHQIQAGVVRGCIRLRQIYGDKGISSFDIYGFVAPDNIGSKAIMKKCGFEVLGEITYRQGAKEKKTAYRLNWRKVGRIKNRLDKLAI